MSNRRSTKRSTINIISQLANETDIFKNDIEMTSSDSVISEEEDEPILAQSKLK